MVLKKGDILNFEDKNMEEVEAFGGTVLVKGLSGEDRDKFESSMYEIKNFGSKNQTAEYRQDNLRARLVAYSVIDEDGNRLFQDSEISEIGKLPAKELDKVFEVAQRLSGISDEDVEDMTKN